jgi:hypothetical protein
MDIAAPAPTVAANQRGKAGKRMSHALPRVTSD